jgi:putative DNA primase/helicase
MTQDYERGLEGEPPEVTNLSDYEQALIEAAALSEDDAIEAACRDIKERFKVPIKTVRARVERLRRELLAQQAVEGTADGIVLQINADQAELAEYAKVVLEERLGPLVWDRATLWVGHAETQLWTPLPDHQVRVAISDMLTGRSLKFASRKGDFESIWKMVADRVHIEGFFDDAPEGVGAGNTFFRVTEEREVVEESLELTTHRQTGLLKYPLVDGPAPLWMKHLRDHLVDDDQIARAQELMGLALIGELWRMRVMGVMRGLSSTGKSVFFGVLQGLVPEVWVSHVPPADFGKDTARYAMVGKRLNICGDISSTDPLPDGFTKTITGGQAAEKVLVKKLYHDPFFAHLKAGILWSCNRFPPSRDRSDGFWNRMCILFWQNPVPDELQDRTLTERILREEGPQIAKWALQGAERALLHGITKTRAHEQQLEEWRLVADPVWGFLRSTSVYITGDAATRGGCVESGPLLYDAFVAWCKRVGLERHLSRQRFYDEMEAGHIVKEFVIQRREVAAGRVFRGIVLRGTDQARAKFAERLHQMSSLNLRVYGEGDEVEEGSEAAE